jgi:hypothetical protein
VQTRGIEDGPRAGPGIPSLPAGHPEGWAEALRDLLRPFYAAVASGARPGADASAAPYPTLAAGARGVAFVEAVLASARDEAWVAIEG